jgi:hypothetical protein
MTNPKIDVLGSKCWYNNKGELHREDGPAIESTYGTKRWYIHGKLHREDGPAVEWQNGANEWLVNGEYHREYGPAIEFSNGDKQWYLNNKLVYSDDENNLDKFEISKEMKQSIIKYKLKQ